MKLPDDIEKLKVEAADKYFWQYRNPLKSAETLIGVTQIDEHFKSGADWGFEQGRIWERKRNEAHKPYDDTIPFEEGLRAGVLHERKRAEGLAKALEATCYTRTEGNCDCIACRTLDQYLKSQGE